MIKRDEIGGVLMPLLCNADVQISREVDAWIVAVLRRAGVKVHTFGDGTLGLLDVPQKWAAVIDALSAGIHAVARGEELPKIAPKEDK
jgi:hypothetical protein